MHTPSESTRSIWLIATGSALRAAFGVIWAIDAYLTWKPEFAAHFVGYFQNAAKGQPEWLQPWFSLWLALVTPAPGVFIWSVRILETAIAVGLLFGLLRKWIYVVGIVLNLLIWVTVEGFGGPYFLGAANLGPALVYVLVFVALIMFQLTLGRTPYSLDYYIEQRWLGWERFAEWAPPPLLERIPPRLPWRVQGVAILSIIASLALLLGTLQSAMSVAPPTPSSAAAAVSPLSVASSEPVASARDATLPPLATGEEVPLTIEATDATIQIASGVNYQGWTFGGTVPGPIIHVRQGQTVNVTFVNHGMTNHSIDFHAATVPPDIAYRSINPGESLQFSFAAETPGVFVYHCGTPPVLLHIGNGMYGAVVVDPAIPLPTADVSYVLVQGEWYTRQELGTMMSGDFTKMRNVTPDEVVFNGVAFQYKDHPLTAKVGQRVRLYVVDAGPNLSTAFHVIGAIFAAVYPDADATHALTGVSTYLVAPGQGVVFDLILTQPGNYVFVDHSMRDMLIGASGVLQITP